MEKLSEKYFPGVPVIPSMSTGATDGLYTSAVGIPTYGVPGSARSRRQRRARPQRTVEGAPVYVGRDTCTTW